MHSPVWPVHRQDDEVLCEAPLTQYRLPQMQVAQLIELAAAAAQPEMIEFGPIDEATVVSSAVGRLTQLLTEVVDNAERHSDGDITVTGTIDDGGYVITVADAGPGMAPDVLTTANRALSDPATVAPGSVSGFAVIGRLAARLGSSVVVRSTRVGTTVRTYLPLSIFEGTPQLATAPAEILDTVDAPDTTMGEPAPLGLDLAWPTTSMLSYTAKEAEEAEAFLAGVFGQLLGDGNLEADTPADAPSDERRLDNVTTLRVRVPGENFSGSDPEGDKSASTQNPIEIRTALSSFEDGRKAALQARLEEDD